MSITFNLLKTIQPLLPTTSVQDIYHQTVEEVILLAARH